MGEQISGCQGLRKQWEQGEVGVVIKEQHEGDFPGGTMVKNPPANAGGHGFEPWPRKIPQATEQLSPCATTTEPVLWSP